MVEKSYEEKRSKYIEGYLFKKEEKWVEYWIVLRECYLMLHKRKPNDNEDLKDLLIGWIEISDQTKCIMGKKKSYSFPFYIKTEKGKYLFKTPSTLLRHQWVKAIELCAQGESPKLIPKDLTQVNRYMENPHDETSNSKYNEETSVYDSDGEDRTLLLRDGDESDDDECDNLGNTAECSNLLLEDLDGEFTDNIIFVSSSNENNRTFIFEKENKNKNENEIPSFNERLETNRTKHITFLPYQKPTLSCNFPSFAVDYKCQDINRLCKSAGTLKQLNVLDSLRTKSETCIGSQQKENLNYTLFSRHLVNSSQDAEDSPPRL